MASTFTDATPMAIGKRHIRSSTFAEEYGQAYTGFHNQLAIAADGAIHAVIDFYEGEDEHCRWLHQATCYMSSREQGTTWQKADGSTV